MRILITGGNGQLGTALKEVLATEEIFLTDTENMDITNKEQIEKVFNDFKPEFLVHGAAYTNVDGCEENPELAMLVNAEGTKNLAEIANKNNCEMIYISTDYVFDGNFTEPIKEDEKINPISVYGRSKYLGEKYTQEIANGYVLRTSWVYGEGHNFVRTMLSLTDKYEELTVVNDQFGRPTHATDLALAIYDVIKMRPPKGIYNVTGDGEIISWADFAQKIFELAGKNTKVVGISSEEYLGKNTGKKVAPRPKFSALDLQKSKNAGIFINNWKESLKKYI